jgi:threonine 3-dehydrogenase
MCAVGKVRPGPGLEVSVAPIPKVGDHEVLLEVKAASLCGTDLHIQAWDKWAAQNVEPPLTVGHECCGVVVETGARVEDLEVGALAAVEGHFFCDHCLMCQTDRRHLCLNMELFGVTIDGGFAEYARVPARNVWKLSPNTPPALGALMDPFGNAVHAVFAGGDVAGQIVAVTGCGPIGLMAVAICRASGAAHILATDVSSYRLELARKMGADTVVNVSESESEKVIADEGVDTLLEFSGHSDAINQGLDMLRPGGRAALLGLPSGEIELRLADQVVLKGISLHGVFGRRIFETWYRANNLLKKVDLTPVITHSFALEDIEQALSLMRSGECGKVVLSPPGTEASSVGL